MAHATLALHGDLAEVARSNGPGEFARSIGPGEVARSNGPGMAVAVAIHGARSVKDAVESIGIPHTEVAAIAVDDEPVDWGHRLVGGEGVQVHPVGHAPSDWPLILQPPPPDPRRFVLDVHLGTLARRLRLLGFDTWWANDADDPALARVAVTEARILATRDRQLLMRRQVSHGVLVRSQDPDEQVRQLVRRYDLDHRIDPRSRCVRCNGPLAPVAASDVADDLEPGTRAAGPDRFARCRDCGQVYWPGAHDDALVRLVRQAVEERPVTR